MTKPLGLSSVIQLSKYAKRAERIEQIKGGFAWLAKAKRIAKDWFAAIGVFVVVFGGIAMTSDETRPALVSVAELRRMLSAERIKAVKEVEEALKVNPPGSLKGFFTLPRKTS